MRTRYRVAVAVAFFLCFSFGCQQKAEDTRAEDERAIRAADAATLKAAQSKKVDAVVANYAEDASWLAPNAPVADGKAAIRTGWSQLIGNSGFKVHWQMNKLEIGPAGDLAYSIYSYQLQLQGPGGKPMTDHGKDLVVWRKQPDRSWRMVAEAFNSDVPAVTPAKSPPKKATIQRPSKRRRRR